MALQLTLRRTDRASWLPPMSLQSKRIAYTSKARSANMIMLARARLFGSAAWAATARKPRSRCFTIDHAVKKLQKFLAKDEKCLIQIRTSW